MSTQTAYKSAPRPAPNHQPELILCEVGETGIDGLESYSMFCIKVHRALRLVDMTPIRRHGQIEDYKDINPAEQVPVLLIDGTPVPDSTDICQALDDLSGGGTLLPSDPGERAAAQIWEELADTTINGYVIASRWADDRNWPKVLDTFFEMVPAPARTEVAERVRRGVINALWARNIWRPGAGECWRRFGDLLDQLEELAPEAGYWTGDTINVADIAIFAQLHSLRIDLTPWQRNMVEQRGRLTAYLDRVNLRTALHKATNA